MSKQQGANQKANELTADLSVRSNGFDFFYCFMPVAAMNGNMNEIQGEGC